MDPSDWTCHEYLGNWYGHHGKSSSCHYRVYVLHAENNETAALHHINKALQLLPSNNVKAELFKIKTYYNFGHEQEACELAIILYDSVGNVAPNYQPYIINNYGIA